MRIGGQQNESATRLKTGSIDDLPRTDNENNNKKGAGNSLLRFQARLGLELYLRGLRENFP